MAERTRTTSNFVGDAFTTSFNAYTRPGGGFMGTGVGEAYGQLPAIVAGTAPRVRSRGSETTGFWQFDPITGTFVRASQSRANDPTDPRRACRPSDVGKVARGGDNPPALMADTLDNLKTLLASQIEAYAVDLDGLKGALREAGLEFAIGKLVTEGVKLIPWVGTYGSQLLAGEFTKDYTATTDEIQYAAQNFYNRMQVRQIVLEVISRPGYTYKPDDGIDIMETCQYPATPQELQTLWGPLKPGSNALLWAAGGILLVGLLMNK